MFRKYPQRKLELKLPNCLQICWCTAFAKRKWRTFFPKHGYMGYWHHSWRRSICVVRTLVSAGELPYPAPDC